MARLTAIGLSMPLTLIAFTTRDGGVLVLLTIAIAMFGIGSAEARRRRELPSLLCDQASPCRLVGSYSCPSGRLSSP